MVVLLVLLAVLAVLGRHKICIMALVWFFFLLLFLHSCLYNNSIYIRVMVHMHLRLGHLESVSLRNLGSILLYKST